MQKQPLKPFTVNLPDEIRFALRKMAATQNLENPERKRTATEGEIARNILINQITKLMEVQNHE
jgi:hypothetical protein